MVTSRLFEVSFEKASIQFNSMKYQVKDQFLLEYGDHNIPFEEIITYSSNQVQRWCWWKWNENSILIGEKYLDEKDNITKEREEDMKSRTSLSIVLKVGEFGD